MKKIFYVIIIIILIGTTVIAEETDIYNAADGVSRETKQNVNEIVSDFDFKDAALDLTTGEDIGIKKVWGGILNLFAKEFKHSIRILASVAVIAIISGILTNMQSGFGKNMQNISFFICYCAILGITLSAFSEAAGIGSRAVDDMVVFTNAIVPAMGTLLIASGSLTSAALQPSILMAASIAGVIIKTIGIPLIYMSLALSLVSNMSDKYSVKNMADFLRKTALWFVSGSLTLFCAIIGITGFATGALDGVVGKTAKFAANTVIPVLGGILADAVDSVAGGALVIKNAAGAAGMLFVMLIMIFPIIKMGAIVLIYRLTAAVIQPVSDKRIVNSLSDMANVLSTLVGMMAAVAVAIILIIAMLINASNMGAMIR